MCNKIINNLPVCRDSAKVATRKPVVTKYREVINGTIYVKEKKIPLSEFIESQTDFRKFDLDALQSAGVSPTLVNPTIVKPMSSEYKYLDNDDFLSSKMQEIENTFVETSETDESVSESNVEPSKD